MISGGCEEPRISLPIGTSKSRPYSWIALAQIHPDIGDVCCTKGKYITIFDRYIIY